MALHNAGIIVLLRSLEEIKKGAIGAAEENRENNELDTGGAMVLNSPELQLDLVNGTHLNKPF